MGDHRLDYERPRPLDGWLMAGRAGLLVVLSLMCVGVPVAGYVTANREMFIVGGVLASIVGMTLAIVGMLVDRRAVVVCSMALAVHVMVEAYCVWTIFHTHAVQIVS